MHQRMDLQSRLRLAIVERGMPDGEAWISVLYPDINNPDKVDRYGKPCGASYNEATEAQRNAFDLQQEILVSSVWEDYHYHWMTDKEWEHALSTDKNDFKVGGRGR